MSQQKKESRFLIDYPELQKAINQVGLDWKAASILLSERGIDPDSSDYSALLGAIVIAIGAERRG